MRRSEANSIISRLFVGAFAVVFVAVLCGDGLGTVCEPEWAPGEVVVKFREGATTHEVEELISASGATVLYVSPYAEFMRLGVPVGMTEEEMVQLYAAEADVEYAELNYYAWAHAVPNDPLYELQWHFEDPVSGINVEPAWDITTGEASVVVAVVDTGVAYEDYDVYEQAPDLAGTTFVAGYDFINFDAHPNDDYGHGTHVAGTIAQSTNNSIGVAGVAYNCSIMPVKVLSETGYGTYTAVADGIYFAVDNGADIINMSLGGRTNSLVLEEAVAYAHAAGVTVICSAGNNYRIGNLPSYPAAYDAYCIAVGATRYDLGRAPYSNTGSYLDVAAPGGDVSVDQNGDGNPDGVLQQTFASGPTDWGYFWYQGTSMAAPHVSGIAAMLVSVGVTDSASVREAIENSARDIGAVGWDEQFGWGLVDAYGTLDYWRSMGDFNGDGATNMTDLEMFAAHWLSDDAYYDVVPEGGDGVVDWRDFAVLAGFWGS